jgi:hypothetical protein
MKRNLKKIITYICLLAVLVTTLPFQTITVNAMYADRDEFYNALFATAAAPYLMTCQPDDAIILTSKVELVSGDQSVNYDGGVFDLPRLSYKYHYEIFGNSNYFLGDTIYPTLCIYSAAKDGSCTLRIVSDAESKVVFSCTVSISPDTPNWIEGIDYWYPSHDLAETDTRPAVTAKKFEDCSAEVVQGIIDAGGKARMYNGTPSAYDAKMHTNAIVMDSYTITPEYFWDCLSGYSFDFYNAADEAYAYTPLEISDSNFTSKYNIKDYIGAIDDGLGARVGLLFGGSLLEGCTYNNNTGDCSTILTSGVTYPLYYFIATSAGCYWSKITDTTAVSSEELKSTSTSAPTMSWAANQYYNLETGVTTTMAGITSDVTDDSLEYGPISFDDFYTSNYNSSGGLSMRSGKYQFMHSNTTTVTGINVYANSLMYNGVIPHYGTLTLQQKPNTLTINYYYKTPTATTWRLLDTLNYTASTFTSSDYRAMPSIDNYAANCWYTDTDLTTKFDPSTMIDTTKDSTISLYGSYTYDGPTYSVTYYNNLSGASSTATYNLDQKPTLPDNPTASNGYSFKNWAIVNKKDDESGTDYIASTFSPEGNASYIFKTMWDVEGIIVRVLTSKTNYYVGDNIDTSLLQVWVQDSSDVNDTRILESNEYTLSSTKISKTGINQFTITYTKTGATAICELNGLEVIPVSISATYKGGDTVVGTELKPSDFNCVINYNNGSSVAISDFTISPTTISTVGNNPITVAYTDYTTSVSITGIKDDTKTATLKSISASFTGNQPYVGSTISASDLLVTAFYSDNTSKTLASTAFTFSPSKFNTAGMQSISVSYSGLSTSVLVSVKDSSNSSSGSNSGSSDSDSSGSSDNNTSSSGSNTSSSSNTNTSSSSGSSDSDVIAGDSILDSLFSGLFDDLFDMSNWDIDYSDSSYDYSDSSATSNSGGSSSNSSSSNSSSSNSSSYTSSGLSSSSASSSDKGTSPGYLHAANILTNTMGLANATSSSIVDIKSYLEAADSNSTVYITLTNGANGNDITSDMFKIIKDKKLNVYLDMISSSTTSSVANWLISGELLEDTASALNPNISFEVEDKASDRLVYFATAGTVFPTGLTLTVYPNISCYGSGELIRLYSCDLSKNNAHLLSTFTWQDSVNSIVMDVYTTPNLCLSNSLLAYNDGASLKDENGLPSVDDTVETDEDTDSSFDWGVEDEEEPFDWGDSETESPNLSKVQPVLIILIAVAALSVLGGLGTFLILHSKRKSISIDNSFNAFMGDEASDNLEDYEEASDESEDENDMDNFPEE